ncbi:hypothetical protein scyTo_0023606, partial [Scyliorhinus torazame]|nr:hypothetical protein [Scyliorhinus torazame]
CCEDCQQWVPGVMFGARKRRFKFYCAECRARRRELGRKLNYYKVRMRCVVPQLLWSYWQAP